MRTVFCGFGMMSILVALVGCARAPEAWVDTPTTRSPVTGLWVGTWKEKNHPGEGRALRCTCLQTGTGQWKATFDAECGQPASFTFDLQGRQIGDRVVLQNAAVIGSDGFGFARRPDGRHQKIPQVGDVVIEDDVEIGAHVAIDRPAFGETRIRAGAKIDNLVQIAHNCQIGRHNLICSQVGIAGSTTTGDYVVVGGQAGIRDHVHVGAGAILSAMAGISNNVPDGAEMMGIPATTARVQRQKQAALAKLPAMRKEFKIICRNLARSEDRVSNDDVKKVA